MRGRTPMRGGSEPSAVRVFWAAMIILTALKAAVEFLCR